MNKKDNKLINLFDDDMRGLTDFPDDSKDLTDFPKEVRRMWVLVTDKGTENEDFLSAYDTEMEALRVALRVPKQFITSVFEANVNIYSVLDMKIISGYEEI